MPNWIPAPGAVVHDLKSQAGLGSKLVALTFENGPHPVRALPRLIESLRDQGYRFVQVC